MNEILIFVTLSRAKLIQSTPEQAYLSMNLLHKLHPVNSSSGLVSVCLPVTGLDKTWQ
jgi:hypothetical protein